MQRLLRTYVDLYAEEFLKVLNEPGVVEQTAARFPGDQEVEIAVLIGFAAGHRAEHAHIVGAALTSQAKDSVPTCAAQ